MAINSPGGSTVQWGAERGLLRLSPVVNIQFQRGCHLSATIRTSFSSYWTAASSVVVSRRAVKKLLTIIVSEATPAASNSKRDTLYII